MPNRLLLLASENKKLGAIATGSRLVRPIRERYVGGTTLDQALATTGELNAAGIDVSLDLLGESVRDLAQSTAATNEYLRAVEELAVHRQGATVSVKLSQLGIVISAEAAEANLRRLLAAGQEHGCEVEVDMEYSSVGRETLAIFQRVQGEYPRTRIAVQAYLRESVNDLNALAAAGARIRLVKGAFLEPIELTLKNRHDVTAQYVHLARWALAHLPDPAFGTHDDTCIDAVKRTARELGLKPADFEFQMLQGVRRPLQDQLVAEGYRVRVYLPYGTEWYPYLTRRMAEKPANLLLFLRSLAGS